MWRAAFPMWRWTGAGPSSPTQHGPFLYAGADGAADRPALWRQSRRPADRGRPDDFEFDDNNIFSFNQLPGYDLVESGPRANVGFIADALFPGGELQGLLGQTYRLKPDPVLRRFTGETGTASDVVGQAVTVKFPHLDFTDRMDFDRSNGTVRRHEIYVTGSYGRSSLQISYVQLPAADPDLQLPPDQVTLDFPPASSSTPRPISISTRIGRPSPPSSATF